MIYNFCTVWNVYYVFIHNVYSIFQENLNLKFKIEFTYENIFSHIIKLNFIASLLVINKKFYKNIYGSS